MYILKKLQIYSPVQKRTCFNYLNDLFANIILAIFISINRRHFLTGIVIYLGSIERNIDRAIIAVNFL